MDSSGNSLNNLILDDTSQLQDMCLLAVYNGRFREAESFYKRALQENPKNVSLVIDYTKMLYRQCRYGDCSAYISMCLRSGITLGSGEVEILNLINSAALVYCQGTLWRALKEAREARERLFTKPIEEFGDAEVH